MSEYFDLKGKTALVTGASSGLGKHFTRVLARAGCNVGLAARREDRLAESVTEITEQGGQAIALPMDVTDSAAVESQLARLGEAFGTPTILINNAGLGAYHGFLNAPDAETNAVFAVNQTAVWKIAQLFAQQLVAAELTGSIVNIASITGLRPAAGTASYSVSKAAVTHMTKVQALELARYGIRVNAIAPGYFDTDINSDFLASDAGQKLIKRIPMRRTGQLEELDGALLLLASDRSAFMTGAILPVDGGHLVSGL